MFIVQNACSTFLDLVQAIGMMPVTMSAGQGKWAPFSLGENIPRGPQPVWKEGAHTALLPPDLLRRYPVHNVSLLNNIAPVATNFFILTLPNLSTGQGRTPESWCPWIHFPAPLKWFWEAPGAMSRKIGTDLCHKRAVWGLLGHLHHLHSFFLKQLLKFIFIYFGALGLSCGSRFKILFF